MPFRKPTVIVVGAGANVDYEMPTGAALLRNTIDRYAHNYKQIRFSDEGLYAFGAGRDPLEHPRVQQEVRDIESFCRTMGAASSRSIDDFVLDRPDLADRAKRIMAAELLKPEQQAVNDLPSKGWHQWLFEQVCVGRGEDIKIDSSQLDIVTFNYDRVLECHLARMLSARSRKGLRDCLTTVQADFPIHHVYGLLSGDRVCDDRKCEIYFSCDLRAIESSVATMKLAGERQGQAEVKPTTHSPGVSSARIKSVIQQAEVVVFLGFGFDWNNVKFIGASDLKKQNCYSTSCGLSLVARRVMDKIGVFTNLAPDPSKEWTCKDLIVSHFSDWWLN